jgi:hypothetical protein
MRGWQHISRNEVVAQKIIRLNFPEYHAVEPPDRVSGVSIRGEVDFGLQVAEASLYHWAA